MAKKLSRIFGVVFLVVAVLGYVQSGNVLGIFATNGAHDLVHLAAGVFLIVFAGAAALRVFGVVYLVVAALGFAFGPGDLFALIHVNAADNWLHLVLGIVLLVASRKGTAAPSQPMSAPMSGGMPMPPSAPMA